MENKNVKEIIITIEGEEWAKAIEKAFNKENAKAKIDGFRPGKAPREIFIKKYGIERLLIDAAESKFQDAYQKMIDEIKGLEIVAKPVGDIKDLSENKVEYVFTLYLRPIIKLGKYKGLGIEKESIEVSKEELARELEETLNQYAEIVIKEEPVKSGDIVNIDFEGYKNGIPFEGGSSKGYDLNIGSNMFIPGFEDQLIGMKKGETKEFEIKFPVDYDNADLKDQKATFKVTVNEVKFKVLPELNKDFFEDLGMEGINSKEDLEKRLEEDIKMRKDQYMENEYINKLFEAAAKEMEVEIPQVMLDDEVERILANYEQQLKMQGISLDDYFKITNSNLDNLKELMAKEAEARVKYRLLLEEVSKLENIEVSEEEVEEFLSKLVDKYKVKKEEVFDLYGGIDAVYYELKMRKAIDILKG